MLKSESTDPVKQNTFFLVVLFLAVFSLLAKVTLESITDEDLGLLWALLSLAGLGGAVLAIKHFNAFVFLFVVVVPLTRQMPYHELFSYGGTVCLFLLYVSRKILLKAEWKKLDVRIVSAVLLYLALVFFSSLQSSYKLVGFEQLGREIVFFAVIYLLYDYLRTPKQWILLVRAIVWCGAIAIASVLLSGTVALVKGNPLLGTDNRMVGIFENPSAAGLVISLTFPVIVGYLQWQGFIKGKGYSHKAICAFFLAVAATVLTVSRISVIGVIFSFFLLNRNWFWTNRRVFLILLFVMLLVLALGLLALPELGWGQQAATLLRVDRGLSGRDFLWQQAWTTFRAHSLLGTGPSTFRYYVLPPEQLARYGSVDNILAMYQTGEILDRYGWYPPGVFGGVIGNSAHNLWLNTAATMGLPGVIAVFFLFIVYWRVGRQHKRFLGLLPKEPYFWIARACLVGSVAFFLRTQFEEPGLLKGAIATNLVFWLTFVLVIAIPKQIRNLPAVAEGDHNV